MVLCIRIVPCKNKKVVLLQGELLPIFCTDNVGLSLSSFKYAGLRKTIFSGKSVFQPFKIIQCHWFWYKLKARMWLPITPS